MTDKRVVPMVPAALIAALAIVRLGAIHAAVFGGFAAASLAQRIEAARPRAIMTASCGIEGAKGPIAYRPLVEGAIEQSRFKPEKVIIWQRDQLRWDHPDKVGGQRNWQRIVRSGQLRNVRAAPVPIKSDEALYIIYTSGKPLIFNIREVCLQNFWLIQLQELPGYPKALFVKLEVTQWD